MVILLFESLKKYARSGFSNMGITNEEIFNEKVQRVLTTINHKEPDRVPILTAFGTWAVAYANMTVKEIEEDPRKEIDAYLKPYEDIYTDITFTAGIAFDAKSAEIIGSKNHFISDDGSTIQHKEITYMEDEDFSDLINDPMGYMFNKMLPRKAVNLDQSPEENLNVLRKFIEHWKIKGAVQAELTERLKTEYAVPVAVGGFVYPPLDIIFDYLRGFKGVSIDLRRRPKELLAAVEALEQFSDDFMGIKPGAKVNPYPLYGTMMHIPTFINVKQFEKFFWPTYERLCNKLNDAGGKLVMFLEGNWENKYEFLNSLPKDFAIGILEDDDIVTAKKKIGDNITVAGGMPSELLRHGTKQECIDHAKKVLDECAAGGGFIFTSDREFISKGDLNPENLIAVNNYVHENGLYK